VELKQMMIERRQRRTFWFESNQSGIETNFVCEASSVFKGLNRTRVELKLERIDTVKFKQMV